MQLIWRLRPPTSGPISECHLIDDSLRIVLEGHTEASHVFIDADAAMKTAALLKTGLYADGWTDADRIERPQRPLPAARMAPMLGSARVWLGCLVAGSVLLVLSGGARHTLAAVTVAKPDEKRLVLHGNPLVLTLIYKVYPVGELRATGSVKASSSWNVVWT